MPAVSFPQEEVLAVSVGPLRSDDDLVLLARGGDRAAFEELYRLHVDRVFALCLRLTASGPRAEECTQDAFVRVWETLNSFRGESRFSTWLHRVAVNVVLADMRAQRRRFSRVFGTDDVSAYDARSSFPSPGTSMDIEKAIAGLPPQARMVFVLHDIEGFKHGEIADRLNVAIGTSKAQLHRARKLLKEVLQQ